MTIVNVPLLPAQKIFVTTQHKYPAMVAGLGSGKTAAGIYRLLVLMLQDTKANTLYAMPTYDLLKLRVMPGIVEELIKLGLGFSLNKTDYSISIDGHGTMYFRSYDNPNRFIAFEVAHSVVDEIDTLRKDKAEEVWRKVVERTRQITSSNNSIAVVSTPDHGIHGFVYEKWVSNKDGDDYQLIKARTTDNKFLPDDYVDQIRSNYDPVLAELYINGEFVNLNRHTVYHFYDKIKHALTAEKKESARLDSINSLHIGLDFNIGGCCANVWKVAGKEAFAVNEFISHDTQDFISGLNRYKGNQITVYPDASGNSRSTNASQSDIQMIVGAGYKVNAPSANPLVRDRINTVNSKLSKDEIFIDLDACPNLSDALETQAYDDKGEPEKFDKHPAIDDHADSAGYFLSRKFPILNRSKQIKIGGMV